MVEKYLLITFQKQSKKTQFPKTNLSNFLEKYYLFEGRGKLIRFFRF